MNDPFAEHPRLQRYREAYLMMAEFYRPQAPSDGFGNIQLTRSEAMEKKRLWIEATEYAIAFSNEEDDRGFIIGCSNFSTNRAFIWTVEAARCLAGGGDQEALKLLKMAQKELASHASK